jgi:hypothetical protein
MKIHTEIQQYSPEWYAIRAGVITASEVGPFILNSGKVADGARLKLVCKKIAELAGEVEEVFPNDAMKRGTAVEPLAREEYARIFGVEVKDVGFISCDHDPLGCSPDGLIYSGETLVRGLEIKGPSASTQVRWLLEGGLPEEHKFQVHMSMAMAEVNEWDFWSFCPKVTEWIKTREAWTVAAWEPGNIPPLHVRVRRDKFTDELMKGLHDICGLYADTKAKMAQLWNERKQAA